MASGQTCASSSSVEQILDVRLLSVASHGVSLFHERSLVKMVRLREIRSSEHVVA